MNLYVVSGVTGMTGNELARQVVSKGDKVIGFDNFFASSIDTVKDILNNDKFIFHEYDINSQADMEALAKQVKEEKAGCDRIIYVNCAAVVHTEHFYFISRTFQTNVLGMKSFMEQAISMGADTYINCSTSEVYSMNSWCEGGVKESDFLTLANAEHSQRTSYATGKLLTEFFMREAVNEGKIKGCSIRFANVYSKHELYPKHIIPHIINSLKVTGSVELLENSKKNRRTFLHNYDSCAAVLALINTEKALDGSVYNVGTEEEITIVDLVYLCAKKLNIKDPKIIFKGYRQSDPERRLLNCDKLKTVTGGAWKPSVSLEKGIEMCIEALK